MWESASGRRWAILGFGLLVWIISTFTSYALFALELFNPLYYQAAVISIGAIITAVCALVYLLSDNWDQRFESLVIGIAWFLENVVLSYVYRIIYLHELDYSAASTAALALKQAYIPLVCLACGFSLRAWLHRRRRQLEELKHKQGGVRRHQ